jgi:putative peptidoglycan lipid II flippase
MKTEGRVAQVAGGIAASRLTGLLREKVAAHFFGVSAFGDVFALVFRGPNLLQNLLGEQSLSASFIPIYARMLEQGRDEDARRFAGAIFALLSALLTLVAVGGVLLAAPIVALLNPGLLGDAAKVAAGTLSVDRYALAVAGVRIIFPMTALLVLSAWCLGVLNSHRRFLLAYVAPVVWNLAIIAGIVVAATGGTPNPDGSAAGESLVIAACLGALAGAVLQVAVQLPTVLRLLGGLRPSISLRIDGVREAISRFLPAVSGRGAAQLSSYLDLVIASFLTVGTLAALGWAQRLYLLPIALFGLSVAAVELPELSRLSDQERAEQVPRRFGDAFAMAGFFLMPTIVAFLAFGFLAVAVLYRGGRFGLAENWLVYLVLGGYTLGLPATVTSRLLQNVFFAAGDTRSPARIAFARLGISAGFGATAAVALDRVALEQVIPAASGTLHSLAPLGLALASAVAAWSELLLLRRALVGVAPELRVPWRSLMPALGTSLVAALPAAGIWWLAAGRLYAPALGLLVLGAMGTAYLLAARRRRIPGAPAWVGGRG